MKLLLDSCVGGVVYNALVNRGFDVVHVSDGGDDHGDEIILERALQQERVLITLDKDFGTLAVHQRKPHVGIVRLVGLSIEEQAVVLLYVLDMFKGDLAERSLVTVDRSRVRIRKAHEDEHN